MNGIPNMNTSTMSLPFITKKYFKEKHLSTSYPNFSWGVTENKQYIFRPY